MNQPEYILEESGKIALTANQLASLSQILLDLEVDSVVLSGELSKLEALSIRIAESLRGVRLPLVSQEDS